MNIAIILFTYNRSEHTKRVLEALRHNTILPQKLYIFQDGLKSDESDEEWTKVNALINETDFCPTEVHVSDKNKGLAASIVSGINYVFRRYDTVIVLEDDCVPAANFVCFMQKCFEKYESDKRVYSVSGYAWPIDLKKGEYDVYGCGRISSWGWGTWKDRWAIYEKNYELISKMKQEKELSKQLALWGNDLEDTLVGNVRGECDSWAVFWALNVIEHRGICINPYYSLIHNIGFDGSGVHCDKTERFHTEMISNVQQQFSLPDQINISKKVKRGFVSLYGNSTAINDTKEDKKENILVYGLGKYFRERERELNENYNIVAFIDNRKRGYYAGKKVIKPKEIKRYAFDTILVLIQNIGECINVAKSLIKEFEISYDVIQISNFTRFEELKVAEDGSLTIFWKNMRIRVDSVDEYNNVQEVLLNQNCCYGLNRGICDGSRSN